MSARVCRKEQIKKNEKNIKKFNSKKELQKEMEQIWKNLQKVIQKGGKNEEKTFKKTRWKKTSKKEAAPLKPGGAPQPGKELFEDTQNTDNTRWVKEGESKQHPNKVSEERWVKKGDFKRPTSTIYHASGAFRPGADIFE